MYGIRSSCLELKDHETKEYDAGIRIVV